MQPVHACGTPRDRVLRGADQPVTQSRDVSGRTGPCPCCGCGRGYEAPSAGRRTVRLMTRFLHRSVERSMKSIEADPAAPGGLVRQVRRQRRAIFEVGEVVDADQRSNRLAMLATVTDGGFAGSRRQAHPSVPGPQSADTPCPDGNTMHRPLRAAAQPQRAAATARARRTLLIPQPAAQSGAALARPGTEPVSGGARLQAASTHADRPRCAPPASPSRSALRRWLPGRIWPSPQTATHHSPTQLARAGSSACGAPSRATTGDLLERRESAVGPGGGTISASSLVRWPASGGSRP